jgi:hypothetical protein
MRWIDPLSGAVVARVKCCPGCKTEKPVAAFPWWQKRSAPYPRCYDCVNRAAREQRARQRAKRSSGASRHRHFFTTVEIAMLAECIDKRMTSKEAALEMGRSADSLNRARRNHYLPRFRFPSRKPAEPHKWKEDRVRYLAELRLRGFSFSMAAKELGETRDAISGAVRVYRQRIRELQNASRPQSRKPMDAR